MNNSLRLFSVRLVPIAAALALGVPAAAQSYSQTNLVTDDQSVTAAQRTDSNLKNPWGIALSPGGGAFWISDNATGVSSLYSGDVHGSALTVSSLVVTLPANPSTSTGTPTGQVFSGGGGFGVSAGGKSGNSLFITDSEDGTLSGWSPGVNLTHAELTVTTPGAVYKGLAIAGSSTGTDLYAANFSQNKIDVFDSTFSPTTLAGTFADPNAVAGYAPFNIQELGGSLYVTYAAQDSAKHDEIDGTGAGYVDVFDTNGNFEKRLASGTAVGGTTSALDAPWGLALAPSDFGKFSNDLLVGSFGSGTVSAFDPSSGAFQGVLTDAQGNPLVNDGLWGLSFGNGVTAGDTNKLYFTAGTNDESDGLFGSFSAVAAPVPEVSTTLSFGLLLALGGLTVLARRKKAPTHI